MILRAWHKCWGKNKERVHVYNNTTIYWLRNFRIRNIIKQQKRINAEAAGHYESESQLCTTLCNSMNVASVHGILQARLLEWVAIPFSRGSSQPRDQTQVSHIAGRCRFFTIWATREGHYEKGTKPRLLG